MGHDVLGVDLDPGLVADHASELSQVMEADTTRLDTLRQIGAEDVGAAVVAIGTDIEASIRAGVRALVCDIPGYDVIGEADDGSQLLEQVRTIDKKRLKERMGYLPENEMNKINRALSVSFGLGAE